MAILFALIIVATPAAQAQTFTVLYNFTGGADGAYPFTGLTLDAAGNLYGTTCQRGAGRGTVFGLNRWLYDFYGSSDGNCPLGRVAFAPDGTLFGTTGYGGLNDAGTVFRLKPSPTAPRQWWAAWNETVLYSFAGGSDGAQPEGDLTLDANGNIYGTTTSGAAGYNCYQGCGVIYELTPSGGTWTETILYATSYYGDGYYPSGGVVFDAAGNLYGVFAGGGEYNSGAVYQLSPSGSGWAEHILYNFSFGNGPLDSGLIIDWSGNLYGTTSYGNQVFELTPDNGGWIYSTLYQLPGEPKGKLVMDAAGNLYGTAGRGGPYGKGSVYKLAPSLGGWTYLSLHDFVNDSDGYELNGSLILDGSGKIYGTTLAGGTYDFGVVFEITP